MNWSARSAALLVIALTAGCSSFSKKWDAAGVSGNAAHASRWDGRWTSARHRLAAKPEGGRLRCVLEPKGGQLLAHFHANWLAFSADYDVTFQPKNKRGGRGFEFSGTQELPKVFGGTYRYDARIVGDRFSATYDSRYDSGTFAMTRQLTNAARIH